MSKKEGKNIAKARLRSRSVLMSCRTQFLFCRK